MIAIEMFKTPILFLIFNRPNTTLKVFEVIRQVKPAQLFIASDGPRNSKEGEKEIITNLRQQILSSIDWECKVYTLFRESNLGCGRAVSEAITWFFEEVEEGIILEDDTLPDLGFFFFCQSLLTDYKDSDEVAIISGTNYLFNKLESNAPYYFSSLTAIWGWATWKRTWEGFNQYSCEAIDIDYKIILNRFKNKHYCLHFYRMLQDALAARMDTWDLQFSYYLIKTKGLAIVPLY
ncbi:MAG: nucleotide-diphospho-sugar transferase, partial [Cytophagales bacterium]|nr:nucleotide-diphospho-sugar transferase [Cytophagales bacterium]